jgi:hypothetical protein
MVLAGPRNTSSVVMMWFLIINPYRQFSRLTLEECIGSDFGDCCRLVEGHQEILNVCQSLEVLAMKIFTNHG